MGKPNELVIFSTMDEQISLPVKIDDDTVWLTKDQMADLFNRDRTVISRHITNVYKENELDQETTCAKYAQVQNEGERKVSRSVDVYSLDVIISVGYRVKSQRGVEFRRWANKILKEYITRGYALNATRLEQLGTIVKLMKRTANSLDAQQVLGVVEQYSRALNILDDYDHQRITRPDGTPAIYVLSYEECVTLINKMKNHETSDLFGHEKDESLKGSIGAIYQSFEGADLYSSVEEKAAMPRSFSISWIRTRYCSPMTKN